MLSAEYLAGLFDGEGCLYVHEVKTKRKHGVIMHMSARVIIANTHLPLLKAIKEQCSGFISCVTTRPGRLQNYQLHISGHDELINFLTLIAPYLVIKKEQVDYFISEFVPTMRVGRRKHAPLTEEQHAKRAEVKIRLQELKRVNFPVTSPVN